jgi:hypothetical protein
MRTLARIASPRRLITLPAALLGYLLLVTPALPSATYYYTGTAMSGSVTVDSTPGAHGIYTTLYGGGYTFTEIGGLFVVNDSGEVTRWALGAHTADFRGTAEICGHHFVIDVACPTVSESDLLPVN